MSYGRGADCLRNPALGSAASAYAWRVCAKGPTSTFKSKAAMRAISCLTSAVDTQGIETGARLKLA
jgi:hypothetical protein